jgi:aerobic C4-dicarboxylate transport protein
MRAVGRIGLKAFIYFEAVTTLCLLFSLIVVHWIRPGAGVAPASAQQAETVSRFAQAQVGSLSAYIEHMVPDSFVGAFAKGDVLQVLVLALLCGIGLLLLGERGTSWCSAWCMWSWRSRRSAPSARWLSRSRNSALPRSMRWRCWSAPPGR